MTDKAILNRPILTLDGKNRQENDTSEDHTIPSNKAIIKDAASVGNASLVAVQKASVNSKTEPAAEQKADYDFTENYPKIHTAAPDTEIMFSMVSSEGLYSSKNRSTLYFDNRALIPCRI
jgi:hypothetical protein